MVFSQKTAPMSEPSQFRHYQIIQDADGNNVELVRNADGGVTARLIFPTPSAERAPPPARGNRAAA